MQPSAFFVADAGFLQPPRRKKEPLVNQRPRRVGYWKASIDIVQPGPSLVNRRFCRIVRTFAETCRTGRSLPLGWRKSSHLPWTWKNSAVQARREMVQ